MARRGQPRQALQGYEKCDVRCEHALKRSGWFQNIAIIFISSGAQLLQFNLARNFHAFAQGEHRVSPNFDVGGAVNLAIGGDKEMAVDAMLEAQ